MERAGPVKPAAAVALVLVSGVWIWWTLAEGGYFPLVLLPSGVVLCVGAALLARWAPWRLDLRRSPAAALALASLAALGVWSLLSATWSPAPDVAIGDGQRILVYALAFGLGLGLCNLLTERMHLALVPAVAAGGVAAVITALKLALGDVPVELLEVDGTLDYPIGYRNANAAFFAIVLFPALGLAAEARLHPLARAAALATATGCVDLFLLSQSRASVPAIALALAVYLLCSPLRLRALCWLALAVLPALGVVPAATELYGAVNDDGLGSAVAELNYAGVAVGLTMLVAAVVGALAVGLGGRVPGLGSAGARGNRAVGVGLLGLAVIAAVGFVVAVGSPTAWVDDRITEFRETGSPDLSERSNRFTINAGSGRYDLWRVALDDLAAEPLLGDGGGGFQYSYLRQRETLQRDPRDAHSVELEVLSELGLPGFGLLAASLIGAVVAIRRSRRLGPFAANLGAVALASGTYWLLHSSLDWFWAFPAVTAIAMGLLGAACAPAALGPRRPPRAGSGVLAVALIVLAVSMVPPFLSLRYVGQAREIWRADRELAYADLERARDLNPFADWPYLIEGEIARESGDVEHSVEAFTAAIEERPEEWAGHFRLAQLQAESRPGVAREQILLALERNPRGPEIRAFAERLGIDVEAVAGPAG
jgi:hypothetical protein